MTNFTLYIAWGILYLLCAALGVLSLPGWVGVAACVLFFVPPAVLLWRSAKSGDPKTPRRIRNISLIWLGFTLFMLILNILTVAMTELAGRVLYYLMAVVCAPLVCGQYWVLSLFLFACLLMTSIQQLKTKNR